MAGIKKNGEQILTWRDSVCALLTTPEKRHLACLLPRNSISGVLDANDTSLILDKYSSASSDTFRCANTRVLSSGN